MEAIESLHKKFVERKHRLSLNLAIAAEQVVSLVVPRLFLSARLVRRG